MRLTGRKTAWAFKKAFELEAFWARIQNVLLLSAINIWAQAYESEPFIARSTSGETKSVHWDMIYWLLKGSFCQKRGLLLWFSSDSNAWQLLKTATSYESSVWLKACSQEFFWEEFKRSLKCFSSRKQLIEENRKCDFDRWVLPHFGHHDFSGI